VVSNEIVLVDLNALSHEARQGGPQWGLASEDLNATLLWWPDQHTIAPHINNEVDVFLLVVNGSGVIVVNGQEFQVSAGQALLIPKGAERAIHSATGSFCYLNIHRRRRLMPTLEGKPLG
jgi:mannose-6-phosphate isomerase-like protein (cupin superfamily)